MVDAHEVHAEASDRQLLIDAPGASAFRFRLHTSDVPVVNGVSVTASGMRMAFTGGIENVSLTQISIDTYEIRALPSSAEASGLSTVVRFHDATA
jgi:hypothetical protein